MIVATISLVGSHSISVGDEATAQDDSARMDLIKRMHETMAAYHNAGQFDGAVLVARDGQVVYRDAFGMASHDWSIPNTVETRFRIGSITKTFTAALALMLVEEGKLDLHEPISTYLPDYRKDTGDRITLHHLLTHSSGLRGEIDEVPGGEIIPYARADMDTVISRYAVNNLEFSPGSDVQYSSTGMTMIGYIIEQVTSQTCEDFLAERILDPLALANTGLATNREIIPGLATGYHRTIRGMKHAIPVRQLYYASAGMYSTVGDLFKYDRALHEGALLSNKSVDLMNSKHYGGQGYAWTMKELRRDDGSTTRIANHHGSQPGYTARIWRDLDDEHCIILMDNHESRVSFWSAISSTLANVLAGESVPSPQVPGVRPYLELIASNGLDARSP